MDLLLASFGPALEAFSKNWPLVRGTPRARPVAKKKARGKKSGKTSPEERWDPYRVTPEDALDVARREVKGWRLMRLTRKGSGASDLDPATAFFVLAWDTFRAPVFDYDEALRLARAIGVDLDREVSGRIAVKRGSKLTLWDSSERAAKGALGPMDGSKGMIDVLHHAAHASRTKTLKEAREMLEEAGKTTGVDQDPRFGTALQAVLEVLPLPGSVTGARLSGTVGAAAKDFDALYNLSRLAYRDQVKEPRQLLLWKSNTA